MCDISVIPTINQLASTTPIRNHYNHQQETATPGYYAVHLKESGIWAELTTSLNWKLEAFKGRYFVCEVYKKTIFILTYDENDGYFDHVPPYVVPNPYKEDTGKASTGIDPKLDFATRTQQINPSSMESSIRKSAIGWVIECQ